MIPYEAIEAAAQVLCEQMWDNAHEKQRAYAREEAREALEAALPYLSEAAKQPQRTSPTDWPDVPRLP